ncbi:MAG TPA: aspartate kinase [Candidatus Merdicola faecigallinarum]|uniref:Aspartokinase n=1 Tax=Candidatus Merdicola faecigallinarum TaxID=2840862 RepID=A0A9D1M276_9FIRM|nr:aspartate kinase [Candidatus Merdicola faecigallinarum]
MDTVVLKFGGSSVADNIKLNVVADKIIHLYETNNVVVVVSAQGKTTDRLLGEAHSLNPVPDDRELDVLLSTGEQITISKLSILLNKLGYPAISLTGWQAGIYTNCTNQNAIIENIDTTRIQKELEKRRIIIVAGFQGINSNFDITTLGRGGSDTTAVAIAAALNAKNCYIFSDVDGVYTTDPNKIGSAKKLETVSYDEMLDIADEGAKVLHNRCVEIGQKFNIPIVTKSTFNNKPGTIVNDKIEDTKVKSIVKNDDIIYIHAKQKEYSISLFYRIYHTLLENKIFVSNLINHSNYHLDLTFTIKAALLNKFESLLNSSLNMLDCTYHHITKISIIGHGIMNHEEILENTIKIIELNHLEILDIELNESKISIMFKEKLPIDILEQLHNKLIE